MPDDRGRAGRSFVRLLHTSDCHLGTSGTVGANERAFAGLVDLAERARVDALLIAGDMFDTARVDDAIVDWAIDELRRLRCPVVILPGNHDWFEVESPFLRVDLEQRCPRIHVLDTPDGELLTLPELDVTFFGRPVLDHDPSFRPLADLPTRPDSGWGVVMGHGLVVDSDEPIRRGSPIYPRDLAAIAWDYVALGHVGRYRQVQVEPAPVVYAGETARSFDDQAGAVMVELSPTTGVSATWVSLPVRH